MSSPGEILRTTTLPSPGNFPELAITSASRGRWGTPDEPGSLPQMISALQPIMDEDGIGPNRIMLISDGSDNAQSLPREAVLLEIEKQNGGDFEPIFFLTPELQRIVVDRVIEKTGLSRDVVEKILLAGEYDANRLRLDAVQSAVVLQNGRKIKSLSLDDDVIPPQLIKTVKPEVLQSVGLESEANSFVFWTGDPLNENDFDYTPNSLIGFFDPLGQTLSDLQKKYPDLTLSSGWQDEMHRIMERLRDNPEIFHVTHIPGKLIDVKNEPDVRIQAVTNTKTRLPDPRTVRYVEQLLYRNLLPPEARIISYIAGPPQPFAFFKAGTAGAVTNVDSANMSWLFTPETANLVRWFPSDPKISRELGMVDWQYRSDNEWLPMYLVTLFKKLGRKYAYFTGITTEMEHHRASSGYRPTDPAEPAASSLIGHEVSEAALGRMDFDQYGRPYLHLDGIEEAIVIPRENAWHVYLEMRQLQLICSETIVEAHKRLKHEKNQEERNRLQTLIHQFDEIYDSIVRRISGRDFETFFERINHETRKQLVKTDEYLRTYPISIEALGEMIRDGAYPAKEWRPPKERNKNYPNNGKRKATLFQS